MAILIDVPVPLLYPPKLLPTLFSLFSQIFGCYLFGLLDDVHHSTSFEMETKPIAP